MSNKKAFIILACLFIFIIGSFSFIYFDKNRKTGKKSVVENAKPMDYEEKIDAVITERTGEIIKKSKEENRAFTEEEAKFLLNPRASAIKELDSNGNN